MTTETIKVKDLILDRSVLNLHTFASKDKGRSAIRHVHFKFANNEIEIAATNGHYLTVLTSDIMTPDPADLPKIPNCAFTLDCDFLASIKPKKSDIVFLDFEISKDPIVAPKEVTIRLFNPTSGNTVEHSHKTGIEIFPDYRAVMPTDALLKPLDDDASLRPFTMGLNPEYIGIFGQYCKKSLFSGAGYRWDFFGPLHPVKITKCLKGLGRSLQDISFIVMPLRIK